MPLTQPTDLTDVWAAIAEIGQPPTAPARGTFLVTGGRLIYSGTGYVYTITGGSGYIDGVAVSWTQQDVTLDAADGTNDRIDVFVVNATGVVSATKGTAAAAPSKPDIDPALYLELTFALVYATTTEPTGAVTTVMYGEAAGTPTEWAWFVSHEATMDADSTTDPRTATKCFRIVNAVAGSQITLVAAAAIDPNTQDLFSFYIKLLSSWNNKASLTIQFWSSTAKIGNAITIKPGTNGLLATNLTTYQGQAFLIEQFAFPVGSTVASMTITVTGATVSFALDDIQLQIYGTGTTVVSSGGISQAEADGRYVQRSMSQTVNVLMGSPAAVLTTGVQGGCKFDHACRLIGWEIRELLGTSGAIKIDVWKKNADLPTDADTITNGHEPEIAASGSQAADADLSDWTTINIADGDWLLFNVDSVTSHKLICLALETVI